MKTSSKEKAGIALSRRGEKGGAINETASNITAQNDYKLSENPKSHWDGSNGRDTAGDTKGGKTPTHLDQLKRYGLGK
jgi:hypothetical protein